MKWSLTAGAILCLALLTSCHKSDNWKYAQIQSGSPKFSSAKLSYFSADIINGIDLEFLALDTSCHLYLQVHCHPLKEYNGNPNQVLITVKCEQASQKFIAMRHKGGQRALLPENAMQYIIDCLQNNHPITISTSGYSSRIPAESFTKKYPLLQAPPRFKSPLYSPLS